MSNEIINLKYMHGQLGNPLFSFAKENNLISKEDHEITQSGSLNLKVHLGNDTQKNPDKTIFYLL